MSTEIITSFGQQCDANGVPVSGAKIHVYDAGTTDYRAVYSDTGLSSATANPIICDSSGRHDMRYTAAGSYKIVVTTSADAPLYTRDNIDGRLPIGSGALAVANGGTGATSASAARTNLGAASDTDVSDLAAEVASLSGAQASVEKTHIATGTTAQRTDSPIEGDIRRNTTTGKFEGYGSSWENFVTDADATATSDVTAETAEATFIRPDRLGNSQRVAKAWGMVTVSGGTPALTDGFNISGTITDNGTGDYTLAFTTALPNANYAVIVTPINTTSGVWSPQIHTLNTGNFRVQISQQSGASNSLADSSFSFVVFGDFA